jgi:hypothetical protein
MIRAILINTQAQQVTEVKVNPVLAAYYALLGVELVEAVHPRGIAAHDVMYVDEEGLLKPNSFFQFRGYPQPLAGNALIVGTDEDGNDIDAATRLLDVQMRVRFYPPGVPREDTAHIAPRNVSTEDLITPRQGPLDLEGQGQSG